MNNDYMSAMMRFKEERMQGGLTQQQICRHTGIAQSAFSKAEAGLRRFSFPETKKLCSVVNIFYVFTGNKAETGWGTQKLSVFTAEEILCHLNMIHTITNTSRNRNQSTPFVGITTRPFCERIQEQLKYLHLFPMDLTPGQNIFCNVRKLCGYTQNKMSAILGMDIKKLRELEKGRLLPDSEVIWKMYDYFHVSPAFILKDVNALRNELDYVLGLLDENDRTVVLQILETWTELL